MGRTVSSPDGNRWYVRRVWLPWRHWIVEATPATGPARIRWKVVGWRRSGAVVDEVAGRLEAGERSIAVPEAEAC